MITISQNRLRKRAGSLANETRPLTQAVLTVKIMTNEDEWTTGQIILSLNGAQIEMEMTVPAKPVKPTRMLPIFQAMASSFVDAGAGEVEANGEKISCRKGCGACCRQAVPLAEIEAYRIADLVENLDEPRRSEIKQKFADACRHLHETGWFERMDEFAEFSLDERRRIVMEYFNEGIACPFLEDESCSIHPDRPLACREYLVTSPAENCARPSPETVKVVEITVKPSKALRETGRSENLRKLNFVPMIRALEWASRYPEKMPEKTGKQWMSDFIGILTSREITADGDSPNY